MSCTKEQEYEKWQIEHKKKSEAVRCSRNCSLQMQARSIDATAGTIPKSANAAHRQVAVLYPALRLQHEMQAMMQYCSKREWWEA